jgi:hypothetical protein
MLPVNSGGAFIGLVWGILSFIAIISEINPNVAVK